MKYLQYGVKIHVNPLYCLVVAPLLVGITIYLLGATDVIPALWRIITELITPVDARWLLTISIGLSIMIAITIWVRYLTKCAYRKVIRKLKQNAHRKFETEHHAFVDRLDHEMRNSLMAVVSGIDTLYEHVEDDSTEAKLVNNIDTHTQRLLALFGDMRKLAEIERNEIESATVEIAPLLTRVFEEAQAQHTGKNRRLKKDIARFVTLSHVQGNETLLAVAVRNLLDNALKYSNENDTVELRAFKSRGEVVIQVADTGPGIAKEDLANVWTKLWRGAQTRAIPGSGIGLALVRAIVRKHNGHINLESEPQIGTEFTIYLPV